MALKNHGFWSTVLTAAVAATLSAQAPAPAPATAQAPTPAQAQAQGRPQQPDFRIQVNLVTTDITVRNAKGQFLDDLRRDEFEIYEDGVKQNLVSMTMVHGGRVTNMFAPPPPPPREGIILPAVKRTNDTSGRIFVFFIDDLNIRFKNTPQVKNIFSRIAKNLLHEGDLLGIISSGPSSISVDLTYDIKRLERAIANMQGDGLNPAEMIEQSLVGNEAPTELRYRAHVAFQVMFDTIANLEKVHDRRKSIVWVSEGYDYSPFQAARYGLHGPDSNYTQALGAMLDNAAAAGVLNEDNPENPRDKMSSINPSPLNQRMLQDETFADSDLWRDLAELTRAAARANTVVYTIDPRGLVAGPDVDENVSPREFAEYTRKTQDTMRVLAEETGGIAVVNSNDYDKGLKVIDNASSDYYVLGYYPSNPDPTHRRRKVEIKTTRKEGVDLFYRKEYLFKITKESVPTR